jgi:hypothetical protein
MKVIHIIKKLEEIDKDINELRKLERQLKKNKNYAEPIRISIEKQINILLSEKIKLYELEIEVKNPPHYLVEAEKEVVSEEVEKEKKKVDKKIEQLDKKLGTLKDEEIQKKFDKVVEIKMDY